MVTPRRVDSAIEAVIAGIVTAILVVVLAGCSPTPSGRADVQDDDDFGTAEVFAVREGVLDPDPGERAAAVWDLFVRVVTPAFAASSMSQYRVGDDADSDTLAYVHRADDPEFWVLAANLAFADDQDLLLSTLIHEYGHILSLGVADADPDAAACNTLELSEGCLAPGSLLLAFDERFWLPYGPEAPTPDDDDADAAAAFYAAHEEDFVSDYAATNVVEDFAESFMTFVLEDRPESSSAVAEKILFFWDVPEYVDIRDRIRTEFALG